MWSYLKNSIKNVKIVFLMTILLFIKVDCTKKHLMSDHPVYGIVSMIDAEKGNFTQCFMELLEFKYAVESEKVWGFKVLDASGRPSSGFLYGNNFWIGSHSQCIDIQNKRQLEIRNDKVNHTETPYDFPPYELAFTMVLLRHNSTLQYHTRMPLDWVVQLGICIPKTCTKQEISDLSRKYFSKTYLDFQKVYNVHLEVTDVRELKDGIFWILAFPKTIVLVLIIGVVLLLTIWGTIYDVREHNREKNYIRGHNNGIINGKVANGKGLCSVELVTSPITDQSKACSVWGEIIKSFSFYSNVKRFTKTKIGPDSLPIIHGLRFFSMGWVICVHTSFFQGDYIQNVPYAYRLTEDFFAQIFSNSTYCVDTYLFLSGFLLAYLFFKHTESENKTDKKSVNYFGKIQQFFFMYIHRFLRLTPTYAIIILLCDVIYTFYGHSSALLTSENNDVLCDSYWWRNILYINNLYPRSEMCLSWSWYLSIDTQCFTISAFLLILSTIYFKTSAVLLILLIFANVTATAYKSYNIGYIPTMDDQLEQLDAIYDLPWNRIGPYLIGVITAYILVVKLKNKMVLKERTRLLLWTVFPLLNLWILFTLYTRQVTVAFSAFYMGVSRTLWGVGIAWLVVACSTRNARLLEKFLSYRGWVPLSRLTYCAYLLNPLVVNIISLGSEAGIIASIPQMAITSIGTIMTTFMIAFVFSMLFESPFILLTKLALTTMLKSPKKIEEVQKENSDVGENNNGSTSTVTSVATV